MSVSRSEDIIALDGEIEAKAKALRQKLDARADLSEVREVIATINELLHERELTKAMQYNFKGPRG